MKISLNIDRTYYQTKPTSPEIGGIRNRLGEGQSTISPDELVEIIRKGGSFTPAYMSGTDKESWLMQQIIAADVDNDQEITIDGQKTKIVLDNPLRPEDALRSLQARGLDPFLIYQTFSYKPDYPKFRVLFLLDAPVNDRDEAQRLSITLNMILESVRPGCIDDCNKDAARLFLGSRSDCVVYRGHKTIKPGELLAYAPAQLTPKPEPKKTTQATNGGDATAPRSKLDEDRDNFDLAGYVERTTGARIVFHGQTRYINPCPFCGHSDHFHLISESRFYAFGSGDPVNERGEHANGTIIDYLMFKENLTTKEAIDKFKYEIMGYDRKDKTLDWDSPIGDDRAPAVAPDPEDAVQPADAEQPTDAAQSEELGGLLTLDRAKEIFEAAPDHYIELPSFPRLSKTIRLRPHDNVILAGDTGSGKSSLALNFLHDLQDRFPIIYFNLEMDEDLVMRRLVAIHADMELYEIEQYKRREDVRNKVDAALTELLNRKEIALLSDVYRLSEIETYIKRAIEGRMEPTIVFIDTALLVTVDYAPSRYERFTRISENLRRIAKLNNIVLFSLLQMNRAGKKGEAKEPTLDSLKESGSWENDSTKVMFLWEPFAKQKELSVKKNRSGEGADFTLEYVPRKQQYFEAETDAPLPDKADEDISQCFDDDEDIPVS